MRSYQTIVYTSKQRDIWQKELKKIEYIKIENALRESKIKILQWQTVIEATRETLNQHKIRHTDLKKEIHLLKNPPKNLKQNQQPEKNTSSNSNHHSSTMNLAAVVSNLATAIPSVIQLFEAVNLPQMQTELQELSSKILEKEREILEIQEKIRTETIINQPLEDQKRRYQSLTNLISDANKFLTAINDTPDKLFLSFKNDIERVLKKFLASHSRDLSQEVIICLHDLPRKIETISKHINDNIYINYLNLNQIPQEKYLLLCGLLNAELNKIPITNTNRPDDFSQKEKNNEEFASVLTSLLTVCHIENTGCIPGKDYLENPSISCRDFFFNFVTTNINTMYDSLINDIKEEKINEYNNKSQTIQNIISANNFQHSHETLNAAYTLLAATNQLVNQIPKTSSLVSLDILFYQNILDNIEKLFDGYPSKFSAQEFKQFINKELNKEAPSLMTDLAGGTLAATGALMGIDGFYKEKSSVWGSLAGAALMGLGFFAYKTNIPITPQDAINGECRI